MFSSAEFSRRQLLTGMLATTGASLIGSVSLPAQASSGAALKKLAAQKGIVFGSAIGAGAAGTLTGSFYDSRYLDVMKAECAILVAENEMKGYVIQPEPGRYNFEPGDRIAQFASQNGMKLRGHTLLWNRVEYLPKWMLAADFSASLKTEGEKFLRDYIDRVCGHYGEQISSWDVVNETIDPATGEVRETPFTQALGFDGLRICYEAARASAPRAQLVYNDYMSWGSGGEKHRAGVLKLLHQFKSKNVPVDALGVQSHIGDDGNIDAVQIKQWTAFIDEVVGMGYQLLITEFDVNDKNLPADIRQRDTKVAAAARVYLDLMLSYRQLGQFLCWGMSDNYSWIQGFAPRADKAPQRPTPYSDTYQPKLLREAIAAAIKAAPKR